MVASSKLAAAIRLPLAFVGWEVLKKVPQITATFEGTGRSIGDVRTSVEARAKADIARRTEPLRNYVVRNQALLRDLADSTPKLGWMKRYVDLIVEAEKAAKD